MNIVTYNIQFGLGKDGRNDLQKIAGAVEGSDIIAPQEVERNWQHSGYVDQPEKLSAAWGKGSRMRGSIVTHKARITNPFGSELMMPNPSKLIYTP